MAKKLVGIVASDKADKTIVVRVVTHKTHPLYRKQYITSKNFLAHDEKNEAQVGDKVSIIESRPLSARKFFNLHKIIERPVLRESEIGTESVEEPTKTQETKKPKKVKTPTEEITS